MISVKKGLPFTAGLLACALAIAGIHKNADETGYVLQHEKEIAKEQPGPHNGGGTTIAMSFFEKDTALKVAFRKRVLHPGSSIGYHLQEKEEIYYIAEGHGIMEVNGKSFEVKAGDAVLTHAGNRHGVKPDTEKDLVLIINYELK
jgi:quercetin dioxygenase-like cupin family protein